MIVRVIESQNVTVLTKHEPKTRSPKEVRKVRHWKMNHSIPGYSPDKSTPDIPNQIMGDIGLYKHLRHSL